MGDSFLELYKKADIALYHAKAKGKNSFACYEPGLAQPQIMAFQQREVVGDKIESARSETSIGSLAEYVFHALYQAGEVEEAIPQILEIIGKQMDVSRVYIFEDSEDGSYSKNTFEWCNRGIEPQKEMLQHVSYAYLGDYYANFNEDGIFYCRDIQGLTTPQKRC